MLWTVNGPSLERQEGIRILRRGGFQEFSKHTDGLKNKLEA